LLPIAELTTLDLIASAPSFALKKAQIDARGLTLGVARQSEVMLFMRRDALDRVGSDAHPALWRRPHSML